MVKYLIIDDEYIAHDIIKGYCDLLPALQLMKHCYDALEALDYLRESSVDLIFLDLNMPKLKGFDFLRTLPNPPKIIVTTAYREFAVEGYELDITDYLLKPFGFERFLKAVNKAIHVEKAAAPIVQPIANPSEERIFLRSNKTHVQVKLNEILYVEAEGNYAKIVLTERKLLIREKLSDVLQMLPEESFSQIHKSFVVAHQHIEKIEGTRVTVRGKVIPIGKMYKTNVQNLLK